MEPATLVSSTVPLSIPAVLQNPKAKMALAPSAQAKRDKLLNASSDRYAVTKGQSLLGKRRIRREENARFVHNPHASAPSTSDLASPGRSPFSKPVFQPPPRDFASALPGSSSPGSSSTSSRDGLFRLSLKGVRKEILRACGHGRGTGAGRAELLLRAVDQELRGWMGDTSSFVFSSGGQLEAKDLFPEEEGALTQWSRSPTTLLWEVPDAFDRWLVHVVARYYALVSVSKTLASEEGHEERRVTQIIKPNHLWPQAVLNTSRTVKPASMDTPPTTDRSDVDGRRAGAGRPGLPRSSSRESSSDGLEWTSESERDFPLASAGGRGAAATVVEETLSEATDEEAEAGDTTVVAPPVLAHRLSGEAWTAVDVVGPASVQEQEQTFDADDSDEDDYDVASLSSSISSLSLPSTGIAAAPPALAPLLPSSLRSRDTSTERSPSPSGGRRTLGVRRPAGRLGKDRGRKGRREQRRAETLREKEKGEGLSFTDFIFGAQVEEQQTLS